MARRMGKGGPPRSKRPNRNALDGRGSRRSAPGHAGCGIPTNASGPGQPGPSSWRCRSTLWWLRNADQKPTIPALDLDGSLRDLLLGDLVLGLAVGTEELHSLSIGLDPRRLPEGPGLPRRRHCYRSLIKWSLMDRRVASSVASASERSSPSRRAARYSSSPVPSSRAISRRPRCNICQYFG